LEQKKQKGICKNVLSYSQDLLAGRTCDKPGQCRSTTCKNLICIGLDEKDHCHEHSDCDVGLYCRTSVVWPFESTCSLMKSTWDNCTEDYECKNNHFCWYASEEDKIIDQRKCLVVYSMDVGTKFGWHSENSSFPTEADFVKNGQFCVSGMAYPYSDNGAKCTRTNNISQNGLVLENPYKCNVTNPNNLCYLNFSVEQEDFGYTFADNTNRSFVSSPCKCALTQDQAVGFCGSVLGTREYERAVAALQIVLNNSDCHTLDRHNFRAQKDPCGQGQKDETWQFAVQNMFNVTYWPYIQDSGVYTCVNYMFEDSFYNLNLEFAGYLQDFYLFTFLVFSLFVLG